MSGPVTSVWCCWGFDMLWNQIISSWCSEWKYKMLIQR